MKKLFFFTLILHCIWGGQLVAQILTVKGKIHTSESLMILFGDGILIDTILTENGEFHFQREVTHPELLTLVAIEKESNKWVKRDFFSGEGEVFIETPFNGLSSTSLTMTDMRAEIKYKEFRSRFDPLVSVARSIIDSSHVKGKVEIEKEVYRKLYGRILEVENHVAEKFVLENTDNIVGAFILASYLRDMDSKKTDSIVNLFDQELSTSKYLFEVNDRLKMLAKVKEGLKSPDFNLYTAKGKEISSKNLLGKYILLDFWGSWCGPCISGIPKMKEYYNKYGDKIEFIGIACRDKPESLTSAVNTYQLNWDQVLNEHQKIDLVYQLQIEAFPTKIIIDPDGNIFRIFKGETEGFYSQLDQIFSEI